MKAPLATFTAIIAGLVVLAGYFLPVRGLVSIREILLDWAVVLTGVAVIVAILGMVSAHWKKMFMAADGDRYSPILILCFLVTVGLGLTLGGPANPLFRQMIMAVEIPVENSLMAALAISLAFAALKIFQKRRGSMAFFFVFSAILFLVLNSGVLASGLDLPYIKEALGALQLLPVAGGRGLLIGIAVGSILAGLKVLLGIHRPYRG